MGFCIRGSKSLLSIARETCSTIYISKEKSKPKISSYGLKYIIIIFPQKEAENIVSDTKCTME